MIIDIHSHIVDPNLMQSVATHYIQNVYDISGLLEKQEEAGIDLTIISQPTLVERALQKSPANLLKVVQRYDDFVAGVVQTNKGRLAGLAVSYPFGGGPFVRELERAVKDLGLKGVMVNPRYGNEFLDSPRAAPFLEAACELDIPVYVHPPAETIGADHMQGFHLVGTVGRPMETTLALARLITYGVLERLPRLKIVAAHLGGGIMMLPGRLNYNYERRGYALDIWGPDFLTMSPGEYLKRIYVDAVSFHPPAVRCAIDTIGVDRVMMGSDFPPVPLPLKRTLDSIRALGLPAADEAKVLGGNAEKLFRIHP